MVVLTTFDIERKGGKNMKKFFLVFLSVVVLIGSVVVGKIVVDGVGDVNVELSGTVTGEVDNSTLNTYELTIAIDSKKFINVSEDDDISTWFNLPSCFVCTVVSVASRSIEVVVLGNPDNEYSGNIIVNVPDGYIYQTTGDCSSVEDPGCFYLIEDNRPNAVFNDNYVINSCLNKNLASNEVKVKIINDTLVGDFTAYNIDADCSNGLEAYITDVNADNVLTITYSGIPNAIDNSKISISIPSTYLLNSNSDLVVKENGFNVCFDIHSCEPEAPCCVIDDRK